MLNVTPAAAAVIVCQADAGALAGLAADAGCFAGRVAPDEIWLVGPRERRGELAESAARRLGGGGLVVDHSDAWSAWTLAGDQAAEVVRRLMFAAVPDHRPGWVQGAITGVPGKAYFETNRIHLFVPAPVGHHLIGRILSVAADLDPTLTEPAPLAVGAGR